MINYKKMGWIGAILIITIIATITLYPKDYRAMLRENPNATFILIDFIKNEKLEFITRGPNWDKNEQYLRWHFDRDKFMIYSNRYIGAQEDWLVYYKRSWLPIEKVKDHTICNKITPTRCYVDNYYDRLVKKRSLIKLYYKIETYHNLPAITIIKETPYYAYSYPSGSGGILIEKFTVTDKSQFYSFPENYEIYWLPSSQRQYATHKLIWRIDKLEFLSNISFGYVNDTYEMEFGKNIKITWKNAKDRFDFAYLKEPDVIQVFFKPEKGNQSLNIRIFDPDFSENEITMLTHEKDEVYLSYACSYYKLWYSDTLANWIQDIATIKTSKVKEIYGGLKDLIIYWKINETYNINVSDCNTICDTQNKTKNNTTISNCTMICNSYNTTKWKWVWHPIWYGNYINKKFFLYQSKLNLYRDKAYEQIKKDGYILIKFCGNYKPQKIKGRGWGVSIEHVPSFKNVNYTKFAWWNSSWQYRKQINFTEESGNDLTNYPIVFWFNHEGHANSECSDIVIINNTDNTTLAFGERNCNSTHVELVAKINLSANSFNDDYFVYYGNDTKTNFANSSWKDIRYNFWDSFESGNFDKWYEITNWAISTSKSTDGVYSAMYTDPGTNGRIEAWINFTADSGLKFLNYELDYYKNCDTSGTIKEYFGFINGTDVSEYTLGDGYQYNKAFWHDGDYHFYANQPNWVTGNWYHIRIWGNYTTDQVHVWVDGNSLGVSSTITLDGDYARAIYIFGDKDGTNFWVDNVTVYQLVEPEPNYSAGSEESIKPPFYSLNSTNSTLAGEAIEHRLKWQHSIGLSGYIFQFCNGTWNENDCSDTILLPTEARNSTDDVLDLVNKSDDIYVEILPSDVYVNFSTIETYDYVIVEWYTTGTFGILSLDCWTGSGWTSIVDTTSSSEINSSASLSSCVKDNNKYKFWLLTTGDRTGYVDFIYINKTNWINDSWVEWSGNPTSAWSNVTKTVNSTVGAKIAWCVYANDTNNNWNGTSCEKPFTYTTTLAKVDINLTFGPPQTNIFRWGVNDSGYGCGPDYTSIWVEPRNQTNIYGIFWICNNGTISGNIKAKLTGIPNTGWNIMFTKDNSSSQSNAIKMTTSYQTIYSNLASDECIYTWGYANCTQVSVNPGVSIDFDIT